MGQTGAVFIEEVSLVGWLPLAVIREVILGKRRFHLGQDVRDRLNRSRAMLERKIAQGEPIYGVSTGFGANAKYQIPTQESAAHQRNLLEFLCVGTGPYLSQDIVRAAMALRVIALSKGWSAVRPVLVETLVAFLAHGITPLVHRYGSVGASGDLVPSAAVARCLCGYGEVFYDGETVQAAEAMRRTGIPPLELQAKEGLALVNGTTTMTGVAIVAIDEADYLFRLGLIAIALAAEAWGSSPDYYDARIQEAKNHPGQIAVARFLRDVLNGSRLVTSLEDIKLKIADAANRAHSLQAVHCSELSVQAPYTLRCVPQGLAPFYETLHQVSEVIEREANSANDNPLVDPASGDILHTGNFYGAGVARAMDGLKLDLCNLANWLHSILALLMDSRFSNGLPDSLSPHPGVSQGLKGLQISHSSLVTAIRHLSAPSLIHSLPTESFNQDVVSLGTHAALTALDVTERLRDTVSMTLLAAAQAVDLRVGSRRLGDGTAPVYEAVRSVSAFLEQDRPLDREIAGVSRLIERREIATPGLPSKGVGYRRISQEEIC